jgi:putative solute:sodium symporter small subunit
MHNTNDGPQPRTPYWRQVCIWTAAGLGLWFAVTFGVSWWSQVLDAWQVGHMPAGYWWATQGAIGVYLLIIVVHGWRMDRLEQQLLAEETGAAQGDAAAGPARHG